MSEINPDYIKFNSATFPDWQNRLDQKGAMALLIIGQDVDGKFHVMKLHGISDTELANQMRHIAQSLDNGSSKIVSSKGAD